MKYYISGIIFLLLSNPINSQSTPTLPHDTILINSLISHHNKSLSADLELYNIKQEKKWLRYIPNLGITYTLEGSPRPSLSYNPISIIRKSQEDKLLEANKRSIRQNHEVELVDKINELRSEIRLYEHMREAYKIEKEISDIDKKMTEIIEEKYKNNLIKPSEYLQEKKRVLSQHKDSLNLLLALRVQYNKVMQLSRLPVDQIDLSEF